MFPQPMSRSEFSSDDSPPDPAHTLEQHLLAGFPLDLALDLVLNELVVRAAEATHATAAALGLSRGEEMVCRAATGHPAPDLGIPLNTRDGFFGACFETRQPQLSVDTEFDPRVDSAISRRLGIRSILIVPVFDSRGKNAPFSGILEVFSSSPAAFSHHDQKRLEGFAEECARVRQAAIELGQRKPAAALVRPKLVSPELVPPEIAPPEIAPPEIIAQELIPLRIVPSDFAVASPVPVRRFPYDAWTLVLGSLAAVTIIAVSVLILFRIGSLRPPQTASSSQTRQPIPAESSSSPSTAATQRTRPSSSEKASAKPSRQSSPASASPAAGELVVYEKGKVIFRLNSAPTKLDQANHQATRAPTKPDSDSIVEASSTSKLAPAQSVWLSPAEAEDRLIGRIEPEYPPDAIAAHRTGSVVLEVQVAEDGSVSNIRTLSGDPVLAAAASEAVRSWRYQPYRQHDHASQFQTDVTLSFTLPN
jgi:TonB family protein